MQQQRGARVGGWPGSFINKVKKIAKSKLVSQVAKTVKSVVQSKITGAAIGAAAVVFPPVGVPAAAAYATANTALAALDKASQIKKQAQSVLSHGSSAQKGSLQAKAPAIKEALTKAAEVKRKLREDRAAREPRRHRGAQDRAHLQPCHAAPAACEAQHGQKPAGQERHHGAPRHRVRQGRARAPGCSRRLHTQAFPAAGRGQAGAAPRTAGTSRSATPGRQEAAMSREARAHAQRVRAAGRHTASGATTTTSASSSRSARSATTASASSACPSGVSPSSGPLASAWTSRTTRGPEPSAGFDVVAEVAFGVGGATETVQVDWLAWHHVLAAHERHLDQRRLGVLRETGGTGSSRPEDLKLRVLLARGARGRRARADQVRAAA